MPPKRNLQEERSGQPRPPANVPPPSRPGPREPRNTTPSPSDKKPVKTGKSTRV